VPVSSPTAAGTDIPAAQRQDDHRHGSGAQDPDRDAAGPVAEVDLVLERRPKVERDGRPDRQGVRAVTVWPPAPGWK
jgi:hypothetical protein